MAKRSPQASYTFGLKTFPEHKHRMRFGALAGLFLAAFVFSVIYFERISNSIQGPTAFEALDTGAAEARDSLNTTRENAVLAQVNKQRTDRGLAALKLSDDFTRCSESRSNKIDDDGALTTSDHLSTYSQIDSCSGNTSWTMFGENLGATPTGGDIVGAWMNSSEHRSNILNSSYNCTGIAVNIKDGTEWWVNQFVKMSSCDTPTSTTTSQALANTSFESSVYGGVAFSSVRDLSKWYTYAASGSQAYRGSSCCAWNGSYVIAMKDYNSNGVTSTTQVVRGTAGSRYTLTGHSLWFKGGAQSMYLDFLNSNYQRISVSGNPKVVNAPTSRCSTTNGWCTISTGAITAPSGTYYVRVILYSAQATSGSEYYWDGITLTRS